MRRDPIKEALDNVFARLKEEARKEAEKYRAQNAAQCETSKPPVKERKPV